MTIYTSVHTHYTNAVAIAVCQFAAHDAVFAAWFSQEIRKKPTSSKASSTYQRAPDSLLIPIDRDTAVQRAYWLLSQITADCVLATQLHAWSSRQPEPQALVLGIVGIEIPGPTLGIINKRKKQKSVMPVFVRDDVYRLCSPHTRFTMIQQTGLQLLSTALRSYGSDSQLDPDFFDWLHHDQLTSVGRTSADVLQEVKRRAQDESILHHQRSDGDGPIALALTPAISDSILDEYPTTRIN